MLSTAVRARPSSGRGARRRATGTVFALTVLLAPVLLGPVPGAAGAAPARAERATGLLSAVAPTAGALGAPAAAPQSPLLWQRTYVSPQEPGKQASKAEMIAACEQSKDRGVEVGGPAGGPRIAIVGDSVDNQLRLPVLADPQIAWIAATHCGENYGSMIDFGRLEQVLAQEPDVLVSGIGSNNISYLWTPFEDLFPVFQRNFERYLDATDGVPCRVVFTSPERWPATADPLTATTWQSLIRRMNAVFLSIDPVEHPNVMVVDWNAITSFFPGLLIDEHHLTHAGINTRANLAVMRARPCFTPDSPQNARARAHHGSATVWWDRLPEPEGITSYTVTASNGASVTTADPTPTATFRGLPNDVPITFTVTARNRGGESTPSLPSPAVVPTSAGSRLHPVTPVRLLDSRDGTGGKAGAFGPGESFTLAVPTTAAPVDAAALVFNVTATDQTADSFVTVWPGGQPRPAVSNLNPRPGRAAVPALVTVEPGPGATVQLFNNSGTVHLLADLVGWYGPPFADGGARYTALPPTRVLDTRNGTGGRSTPFGPGEAAAFHLGPEADTASAVVLNVTAASATRTGFVTLWPSDAARPVTSVLNPEPGPARANLAIVRVGPGGTIAVYNNSGDTHLVLDLVGVFGPLDGSGGGSEYFPTAPTRVIDSRDGTGGTTGPVANAEPFEVSLAGGTGAASPHDVLAVDANVTVVDPAGSGHATTWGGGAMPATSTLNFSGLEVASNRVLWPLDGGAARVWASSTTIHYVVDVTGWFGPAV